MKIFRKKATKPMGKDWNYAYFLVKEGEDRKPDGEEITEDQIELAARKSINLNNYET